MNETVADKANGTSLLSVETREFVESWCGNMSQVLTQVAGKTFTVQARAEPPSGSAFAEESGLQVIVTASGALRGEMSLRLPADVVVDLARIFLGESGDAATELTQEHKDAVEELLRQISGHVATGLKPRWGEVQLRLEQGSTPTWSAASSGWMASGAEAPCGMRLEWKVSAALSAALAATTGVSAATPTESQIGGRTPGEPGPTSPKLSGKEARLDLLMDVELDVTLRFGGRTLLLREILELTPGAVVELDRQIQEPADLLLDGKLIARGEVVVVDGNYGLRVLEMVASPLSA